MTAPHQVKRWIETENGMVRFHGTDAVGRKFDLRLEPDQAARLIFVLHRVVKWAKQDALRACGGGKAA